MHTNARTAAAMPGAVVPGRVSTTGAVFVFVCVCVDGISMILSFYPSFYNGNSNTQL